MNLFVKNIAQLVTVASRGERVKQGSSMRDLGVIHGGGVLCREGRIAWVGAMRDWTGALPEDFPELDAEGSVVLPGFVDAHTHMVFAGTRAEEFALRAEGVTYQEIAERGGGIVQTVRSVRAASRRELKRTASRYLTDMLRHGTTTVEIKTGYGLDMDNEVKMLEAINELRSEEITTIVPTFIGAHAIPPEFQGDPSGYIELICEKMIPYAGSKRLALFCDVFCEKGYFGIEESERILLEGKRWGMVPKIHADELTPLGGAELGARVGAVSADHLEHVSERGISALAAAGVVAVLLPGVSLCLRHEYAPARAMIDAGVPVAIASDFNPGSCMSYSLPLMMTIACTQMRMTPEEALTAITLNAAAAVGLSSSVGSIELGKQADLLVADIPDYQHLAYHFGTNLIRSTVKNGTLLEL